MTDPPSVLALPTPCARCATQLAPGMLSCPLCGTLVHAAELKAIAAAAQAHESAGRRADARAAWERARSLLPASTRQHATITRHLDELARGSSARAQAAPGASGAQAWWRRGLATVGVAVLFALGKLKLLLLGLTKATTFLSMFAFFGLYWTQFGWALAAGLVVSIYIHEMGHVAALRRAGVAAGAPVFIPGFGALVLLKEHIDDPVQDARMGLAGPIWGLGAGLAAYAVYAYTRAPIWEAIAHLTGYINLFNLLPVWQLDGARGFHALSGPQRWLVAIALAVAFLVTSQGLLLVLAAVAAFRALQPGASRPHAPTLAWFLVLIAGLSALATLPAH